MPRFIVDANAFLRLLLDDVPSQADQVEKTLKSAKENLVELLTPQIVIFELAFALDKYYHFPKEQVIDKLKVILSTRYLKIQDREVLKKAIELFGYRQVSLVDCFLICFAGQKEADILTFDKKLKKLME